MNLSKTKCILFSNKKDKSALNGITMSRIPISEVTEIKHLGLTMDTKLTWKWHIDTMITKASKSLAPIYLLRYKLPTWCLLRYYKTFIIPILEYADTVLAGCSIGLQNKIEQVQYKSMICIADGINSTSGDKLRY